METESMPPPTPIDEQPVRCELCGAALANHMELREHLEGHAEKQAEGFPAVPDGPLHKCAFCDAGFETAEELKAHHARSHGK
jgi:Zinc finger, C2H2 type